MFDKDPRLSSPEYKKLSAEQKAMVKLEITLTRFAKTFERSTQRWERMVYPAMFVIAVLALSGFYLIYAVTKDMNTMAQNVDPNMSIHLSQISGHMQDLSINIATMTGEIKTMVEQVESMETRISNMDDSIIYVAMAVDNMDGNLEVLTRYMSSMEANVGSMNKAMAVTTGNITEMNQSMKTITANTAMMNQSVGHMNQSVGRPMSFMNSFMPW